MEKNPSVVFQLNIWGSEVWGGNESFVGYYGVVGLTEMGVERCGGAGRRKRKSISGGNGSEVRLEAKR